MEKVATRKMKEKSRYQQVKKTGTIHRMIKKPVVYSLTERV